MTKPVCAGFAAPAPEAYGASADIVFRASPRIHLSVVIDPDVGRHFGVRTSDIAPKKPSNVRISSRDILTFDGSASLCVLDWQVKWQHLSA